MKNQLFALLRERAYIQSNVTLASGERSSFYFDCRQVYLRGDAQFWLGELFFEEMLKLEAQGQVFTACGGMALGCIPLTCAMSAASYRRGREFSGVFVRKAAKDHGMMATIEGARNLPSSSNILLLEDVVTSGGSALVAAGELRKIGAHISTLFCIIDRGQGAREALKDAGIDLVSLFNTNDFML